MIYLSDVWYLAQVEYARGVLRRLAGDLAENRELAVVSLERAIRDYEARLGLPTQYNSSAVKSTYLSFFVLLFFSSTAVRALRFYREKTSALSYLVDSSPIAPYPFYYRRSQ